MTKSQLRDLLISPKSIAGVFKWIDWRMWQCINWISHCVRSNLIQSAVKQWKI